MRKFFFGPDGSILWNKKRLEHQFKNYRHYSIDIREEKKIDGLFKKFSADTDLIVHAAAQPSHDWAARAPMIDFGVNALGTVVLLEAFRKYCPKAVFIFVSTNKVYGDRPNSLPLIETETRFELPTDHRYYKGIDETMSIDDCLHSIFGASKVGADVMAQEYGRYFGLKIGIFRGGCLTGPAHSGAELHGFLSYLVKCLVMKRKYKIFGYKGKQVRDNIHSHDLVNAFYHFFKDARCGEAYNIGGSRFANVSVMEAIKICEKISGESLEYEYLDNSRRGDHIWWISDVSKFQSHYPSWEFKYGIDDTIKEIYAAQKELLAKK
jgi:CDP-paratose 2-epimerase